jgi:hypothetical protein
MEREFKKVEEQTRTYWYIAGPDMACITVEGVIGVAISDDSGSHRLKTVDGKPHAYIKPGWSAITFDAENWSI